MSEARTATRRWIASLPEHPGSAERAAFAALLRKYPGSPEPSQEERNQRFATGEVGQMSPVLLEFYEAVREGRVTETQYTALVG